jgi:hypothetical protein
MKFPAPLVATLLALVFLLLVGLVWFELPKAQREARRAQARATEVSATPIVEVAPVVDVLHVSASAKAANGSGAAPRLIAPRPDKGRKLRLNFRDVADAEGKWWISVRGNDEVAPLSFSPATALELEDLSPGPHSFTLLGPDGALYRFDYTLAAGRDSELELRLR